MIHVIHVIHATRVTPSVLFEFRGISPSCPTSTLGRYFAGPLSRTGMYAIPYYMHDGSICAGSGRSKSASASAGTHKDLLGPLERLVLYLVDLVHPRAGIKRTLVDEHQLMVPLPPFYDKCTCVMDNFTT